MRIGKIELNKPLVLAPMENVTDRPFRLMCKQHGADLLYTEFVNCEALIRNVKKSQKKTELLDEERPIGIQIYGNALDSMERAARLATEARPDFIDINAGCWVKKIALRGDGAGLLRDLNKMEAVIKTVVNATQLPVTLKTRLGWDNDSIVILDVARMAEQCGVQALAVHCRTRQQAYRGQADWSWLEKIKEVTSVPLIGNGDVKTPEDFKEMFDLGCDGVMVGRAVMTNPWLFKQAKHFLATGEHLAEPNLRERTEICLGHLKACVEHKGERRAVLEHRKLYSGYFKGLPHIANLRKDLMEYTEVGLVEERVLRFLAEYERHEDLADVGSDTELS